MTTANYDFNCPIIKDKKFIFWEARHCLANKLSMKNRVFHFGGFLDASILNTYAELEKDTKISPMNQIKEIIRKLNTYNLVPNEIYE